MATLKSGPLGNINGKLGNIVARVLYKKTVISTRPAKYKKTKSEKAKYIRGRFAITVEFSRYINSIKLLKDVWNYNFPKCSSAFNMIERYNIKNVGDNAPSLQNIITPPPDENKNYLPSLVDYIRLDGKVINAALSDIDSLKLPEADCEYFLVLVILYYEPKIKSGKYFKFDNIIFSLDINSGSKEIGPIKTGSVSASYKKAIIFSASVAKGTLNNKLYYSNTSAQEFIL